MAAGGHFAIAVFERDRILQHKTFHKYIIRAKQGTAQSAHDQKTGGKARSAGANLRRQNMLHLKQKIQDLFLSWKAELQRCSLIFVRAPSFNQQLLFGDKNPPLSSTDPRCVDRSNVDSFFSNGKLGLEFDRFRSPRFDRRSARFNAFTNN